MALLMLFALVAGALSMATGEYVSVSTQRDAELALIEARQGALGVAAARTGERDLGDVLEPGLGHGAGVAHAAGEVVRRGGLQGRIGGVAGELGRRAGLVGIAGGERGEEAGGEQKPAGARSEEAHGVTGP